MTDNEKSSTTAMSDNEIIKANDILDKFDFFNQRVGRELWSDKPKDIQDKDIEIFSNNVKFLKDFINRLQADKEALIAGQETLQKALAEKNKEIQGLRNTVVYDISNFASEYDSKIKAEVIKECIEKTQAFLAIKCRGVVEDNPNLDEILWGYRKEDVDEFFDNLVKETVGEG